MLISKKPETCSSVRPARKTEGQPVLLAQTIRRFREETLDVNGGTHSGSGLRPNSIIDTHRTYGSPVFTCYRRRQFVLSGFRVEGVATSFLKDCRRNGRALINVIFVSGSRIPMRMNEKRVGRAT